MGDSDLDLDGTCYIQRCTLHWSVEVKSMWCSMADVSAGRPASREMGRSRFEQVDCDIALSLSLSSLYS